jgi:hypothetical protein
MLGGLAGAFLLLLMVVVTLIISTGLDEIEDHNAAMRKALSDLERNRECYVTQRHRRVQLEGRMSHSLELNRFVETAASAVGVEIAESGEIAPVQIERYTQRGVEIKLRKVNIGQLAKLLRELEGSPGIVQITRLSVNTRWGQSSDLDVEMVVSTFERRNTGGENNAERRRSPERG